jgi:hypothetical protein
MLDMQYLELWSYNLLCHLLKDVLVRDALWQ